MWRWWAWLFLLAACLGSSHGKSPEFLSDTLINNVVLDPSTGRVYVGAVNALYQLSPELELESRAETGPRRDNRQCTPPITEACEEAKDTDNHNKLLLVHGSRDQLVVCGSLFRGMCSLRNLSQVEQLVYFSDTKGEKSYVASAEESVSVVGVMSFFIKDHRNFSTFMVGKGYGGSDSTKLISTRVLEDHGEWVVFDSIVEASPVQANPFMLRYLHDFRFAFKDGVFIYFLFSRTLGVQDTKNFTFVARMCEEDQNYFSYTELQLNCTHNNKYNKYNKAQAAYLSRPGRVLAQNMTASGEYGTVNADDRVLFVTFTSDEDPTSSALCLYPVSWINRRLLEIIGACYTNRGLIDGQSAVYSPYSSKTEEICTSSSQTDMASAYRCGADFLPSPLASRAAFALSSSPALLRPQRITAVAVAVEEEHAVAFLGTANGEVLKAHLSKSPEVYGRAWAQISGDSVNKNLLLEPGLQYLYVTTGRKLSRVMVQSCEQKPDCQTCVSLKDPYCGWCVLEGRCTRKQDCSRSEERNSWLWSPDQTCVQIQVFQPPNLSCRKSQQVSITVPALPPLRDSDSLQCDFGSGSVVSDAVVIGDSPPRVVCSLPAPAEIPPTPGVQDYVSMSVKLVLNKSIEVTSGDYQFYSCSATHRKSPTTPCLSCLTSRWSCQWNPALHVCSDDEVTPPDPVEAPPPAFNEAQKCPLFESLDPQLIPVGFKIPMSFRATNMDLYTGHRLSLGSDLMVEEEPVSLNDDRYSFSGYEFVYDKQQEVNVSFHVRDQDLGRMIDSELTAILYNCSVNRDDCSLCTNADPRYQCVWCSTVQACVYRELCPAPQPAQCPNPDIYDIQPRFGPLEGGIRVTLHGSNMGVAAEDVTMVTVAGVACSHQRELFSVSTTVVCEIGPAPRTPPFDQPVDTPTSGPVEIDVDRGRRGTSKVVFTYRDPKPEAVEPAKGPTAGGTVITITGTDLDTATKDDITVTVGGVSCEVLTFGERITCRTGRYRGQKVPSEMLTVSVKYGRNTEKDLASVFQYAENPKIFDYNPKDSFMCGGRRIVVVGSGFELIQEATMKVLLSPDEFSQNTAPEEFLQKTVSKNDSVMEFDSPAVNPENLTLDSQPLKTLLHLDNFQEHLTDFNYHPDPVFDELAKNVLTETSIIIVAGRGFSKAMTAKEAQAFVGDASCHVNILQDDKLILDAPSPRPKTRSRRQRRDTSPGDELDLVVKFGYGEWLVGSVHYAAMFDKSLWIIVPSVVAPMLLFIAVSVYCYRKKSRQAEREYEKVKHQLENLEESVRDRCKKEFTDLMIEMEDHTSDLSEARIPFLDYQTYTDRNFFLPSKGEGDEAVISEKVQVPRGRRTNVVQALNQFSNLLNSKTFLINFIRTLESRPDFNARSRGYFASLLTVALHGKLEYYTDIMRTLLLELMDEHVQSKNPKLMLRRSETVVERMLCNWMSICLYQFLKDTAGEPLYKLFKALKHQVEKGPVDHKLKKAKYTLNDTGLLGDDVEYSVLTLQVLVHGEGPDVTLVKVLNCDTITQVKEKIIDQVHRNLPYSQRPTVDSVALEWRPGSTGQILSDLDLTSQKEGRWKRLNTLAHYNVRDEATLVLSRVLHSQSIQQHPDTNEERNALLEEDHTYHLVRPVDELDDHKSKRGSMKDKPKTKAITEIYLTRLLAVKGTLQKFVDDFFRCVLSSSPVVPPVVKYFFDFLDEQALRHDNVDEETLHIWKTNSLLMRFWVNILRNPHFIFDVHVTEVVDASLHVISQTLMDACTKTEHKLSRDSPSNKLLYAKEISNYKKMVEDYYSGIKQMVSVSDQDMNTHLAEVSRQHTGKLDTQAALHQLYQYASKYYDAIIQSLDDDPAAQNKQLTLRLQQIAAALENKVTDL